MHNKPHKSSVEIVTVQYCPTSPNNLDKMIKINMGPRDYKSMSPIQYNSKGESIKDFKYG